MRIAIVSDAWTPQVNGVVRTLWTVAERIRARGHDVATITPDAFRTVPCPTYPEIRLALGCGPQVAAQLAALDADAVHIATEGPLGWAARRWCLRAGRGFTTSFHTRFPDYLALRTGLPANWFWPAVRRFHAPAARTMAATAALADELAGRGIGPTHRWSRGVDFDRFRADAPPLLAMATLPRPIQLYVGRVAVEKNIEAFLALPTGGTKVVVGDGPARAALVRRHPDARFLGTLDGKALTAAYAAADVLAFPSLTDTFGLVMIEAMACGTPVAAFPVAGPRTVVGGAGALDDDLGRAIARALAVPRAACVARAARFGWAASTDQFLAGLCVRNGAEHRAVS